MRRRTELMFHVAMENVMRGSKGQAKPVSRPGRRRKARRGLVHSRASSLPPIAGLVGRQFVDVEQRRVRLGGEIEIEQGDDRLEALGVDHRPLPEGKGRGVKNEREMRRAAE